MTRTIVAGRAFVAALAFVSLPAAVAAQGNASSAAAAMGGNYTAVARNFNAVAWNPANLALNDRAKFSMAIVSPQFALGTGPVTLADFNDYAGEVVPVSVRQAWLQKVIDNDGQAIGGDIDITPLAISIGEIGLSATTSIRANGAMPAGVAELLFFGNAGRTGSPQDFAFGDLKFDGNAVTTFSAAFGQRMPMIPLMGQFTLGVTGKYIVGHGMASMRDNGSTLSSDPVEVNLNAPMVLTDTASANNGSGFGIDLGAAWVVGDWRVGAHLRDVINTFQWKTDDLYYMPVRATFDAEDSDADIEEILPLSSAPAALQQELRDRIDQTKPQPTLALGAAYTGFSRLTLAGDIRQRFGEGLELGPKTHIGVGAELRVIPAIPLRAGVTSLTGGMRYSGGLGLEFGVVNFQVHASLMQTDGRSDTGTGFTLSFGGR